MANYKYGVITALVTPFKDSKIDFKSLEKLVKFQIENGIEGFVINGTTAESPTLNCSEVEEIFRFVKNLVPSDFPLILGTGSNSTEKTIEASIKAEKMGLKSILVVVPYYNKPPQRGLIQHFKAIAKSFSGDVILYNVPGRTITSLSVDSIKELSQVKNIVGIKEATGNIEFAKEILAKTPSEFVLLSGDDGTFDQFMQAGGDGIISVATHIMPKVFVETKKQKGKTDLIEKNKNAIEALYVEANPIPVKAALKIMNIIESAELRLPLTELDAIHWENLKHEMAKVGIK